MNFITKEQIDKILFIERLDCWYTKYAMSGICLHDSCTIAHNGTIGSFLHELAHALCQKGEGHSGAFADKFSYLVNKYLEINDIYLNDKVIDILE